MTVDITIRTGDPRTYRCKRGHVLTACQYGISAPVDWDLHFTEPKANTGPLCHVCIAEWAREQFGVVPE